MVSEELKDRFFEALNREDGSISAAARAVGVNRETAFGWARRSGIRGRGKPGRGEHPRRADYDRLRASGVRRRDAAAQVGINERTARDWDKGIRKLGNARLHPDGRRVDYNTGVTTIIDGTQPPPMRALEADLHPRCLTLAEREQIADLRRQDLSLREIGRQLGRPASTIKRELDNRSQSGSYRPYAAHRSWARSRARPKGSKLAAIGPLREYVTTKLEVHWSPEQICHALIKEFPDDESTRVSAETIYQAIYVQARGGLRREVAAALRTGRTRRKPQKQADQRTTRFTDPMVMISDRPPEVEDRAVPGH